MIKFMKRIVMTFFLFLVISNTYITQEASSMDKTMKFPKDLTIEGTSGGLHPWEENHSLRINASGIGQYTRYIPGDSNINILEEGRFNISMESLQKIWEAIKKHHFFNLQEEYLDEDITGGEFATLTVTAEGNQHTVNVENIMVTRFDACIKAINAITPAGYKLVYNPPSHN